MPITDIWSYVTTGEEFKTHWEAVNLARTTGGGTALTLPGGYSLANLTADVAAVQDANSNQEGLDNGLDLATAARDTAREFLRNRLMEFRDAVQYRLPGSGYERALPQTPHEDASEQKLLKALDDMLNLWTRINGDTTVADFTPPLLLRGSYALAAFSTALTAMRATYQAVTAAENDARLGRGKRDVLLDPLRDRFVQYRKAIEVEYGPTDPFTTTLPSVYSSPGSTPTPVVLSGSWNASLGQFQFSWTASSDPNLDEYELRRSEGASYNAATATVVGNAAPGTTTLQVVEMSTGNTFSFKLFTKLTTNNESGSNTVTITRP